MVNDELLDALWDEYGHFDEINFDNSSKSIHPLHISNVKDPLRHLELLSSRLSRDGVISVQAPDLLSLITNGHFGYIYHEHQSYFSTSTIQRLFRSIGFQAQRITPAKDGLNMCYRFVRSEESGSRACLGEKEQKYIEGMNTTIRDFLLQFRRRLEITSERVQRELSTLVGTRKIGYGASVATVTTMYQLGINAGLDFLVDDSKKHWNCFSPRDNLVVQDAQIACNTDPLMSFVILATRYEDQILKNHPELVGRTITAKMSQ
jgi:hypothetical protein